MRGLVLFNLFVSTVIGAAVGIRDAVWQPNPGSRIQMILSGTVVVNSNLTPKNVDIFDIDLFDTPASTVSQLRAKGINVICYFSAGTGEDWRPDYSSFLPSDLGSGLPDWQGEKYLNLRSSNVLNIMKKRIQMASQNGCSGIDPDNMDAFSNGGGGFNPPLTEQDSINFVKAMAAEARKYGMGTGLKNAETILSAVQDDIQFAVNEECKTVTNDCNVYDSFVQSKPVYHVEYAVRRSNTDIYSTYDGYQNLSSDQVKAAYCLNSNPMESKMFSTIIKELDLGGWVLYCDGTYAVTQTGDSDSSSSNDNK